MKSIRNTRTGPAGRGRYAQRVGERRRFQPVMISFPNAWAARLDAEAIRRGYESRSALVRAAIEAFLGEDTSR